MVNQAGCYEMTAEEYHADPAPSPSLSSSIARLLLTASAQHAWFAHPRLNPGAEREEKELFDLGTAAHAYLLQGESGFAIIEAPDWRTKAAKDARDAARLEGKVPLLAHRWQDVQDMAMAARAQLAEHEAKPIPFTGGKAEQTLIWREGDVWCRARLDWLHEDYSVSDDLKTTAASANPEIWSRTLFGAGHDIQAAFYLRGLRAVGGERDIAFRFIVQENFRPFALAVIGLAPDALALAERKVKQAIALWDYCLKANQWPGYPTQVCWAELPPWENNRWLEREMREEGLRDDERPIGDQLDGIGN